jgi:hypothetical protein
MALLALTNPPLPLPGGDSEPASPRTFLISNSGADFGFQEFAKSTFIQHIDLDLWQSFLRKERSGALKSLI